MLLRLSPDVHLSGCGKASLGKLSRCAGSPDVHTWKPPGSPDVLGHPCAFSSLPSCDMGDFSSCWCECSCMPRPSQMGTSWRSLLPQMFVEKPPPLQLCPKSPPDVTALGDPDVQTHVDTIYCCGFRCEDPSPPQYPRCAHPHACPPLLPHCPFSSPPPLFP